MCSRCVALVVLVVALGCARETPHPISNTDALPDGAAADRVIELVARTPYLATYPCGAQCHDERVPDPTRRELVTFHAARRIAHGPAIHWCDDCHSITEPDHLVSLDGQNAISFDHSDELCGQCHGERHADWSEGMHGLSTGGWRGTVRRRTCTACHDPHAPEHIQLEALAPPRLDPRLAPEAR